MRKVLCMILCTMATSASAYSYIDEDNIEIPSDQPSSKFYIGAEAGYANSTYKNGDMGFHNNLKHTGFAARLNAGYMLTPHFAIEMGGSHLPDVKWISTTGNNMKRELEKRYLLDVFIKGILPLQNHWNISGKIGLAWYHVKARDYIAHRKDVGYVPAFGFGFGYDINSHFSMDLDYLYYGKKGNAKDITAKEGHYFKDTHFIAIGLTYHFGA